MFWMNGEGPLDTQQLKIIQDGEAAEIEGHVNSKIAILRPYSSCSIPRSGFIQHQSGKSWLPADFRS
jgi:hypothetical protein